VAGNPEELALVQRCVAGELDAWRALMKQYGALVAHAVRNVFQRVLQQADPNFVDDAVQGVWLSLCADGCRRLRGFQMKSALSTWLTVLSSRKALDYIRTEMRKGAFRNVHLENDEANLINDLRDNHEPQEKPSDEDLAVLFEALERLPSEDRLILKMYYLDGLSYRTIAHTLRVAPNTVSSYIFRAREKLKQIMHHT
jgi:RNA polymerase sigma-70 factor (ECF subfamily)